MSNTVVQLDVPVKLEVDNDKSANELCRAIFSSLSVEFDSLSMFCIVQRKDEVTFHSSKMNIAEVLYQLEKFKHDLLSGRYGDKEFSLDL